MIKWLLKCKRDQEIQIDFIEVLNDLKPFTGKYLMEKINFLIEKKRKSQDKYDSMNGIKILDSWISFYINDQGRNFEKIKLKECDMEDPDNAPYSRFIFECINDVISVILLILIKFFLRQFFIKINIIET